MYGVFSLKQLVFLAAVLVKFSTSPVSRVFLSPGCTHDRCSLDPVHSSVILYQMSLCYTVIGSGVTSGAAVAWRRLLHRKALISLHFRQVLLLGREGRGAVMSVGFGNQVQKVIKVDVP